MARKNTGQKLAISRNVTIVAEIECCICEHRHDMEVPDGCEDMRAFAAERFYRQGWRERDSEKFQLFGVMCEQCANTPDEDRGE